MGIYAEIMEKSANHVDPIEAIQWEYDHLSPDELAIIGHVFLALAQWKPNELTETQGVTRVTPDGAGDSGEKFSGGNQVTEFPAAPKMPTLAHVGGGKL
jgi:hypothetical protein